MEVGHFSADLQVYGFFLSHLSLSMTLVKTYIITHRLCKSGNIPIKMYLACIKSALFESAKDETLPSDDCQMSPVITKHKISKITNLAKHSVMSLVKPIKDTNVTTCTVVQYIVLFFQILCLSR